MRENEKELAARITEHDCLECYCHALKNPPWGGYSVEEQFSHEMKQRKKGDSQVKRQSTGTSYTYLNFSRKTKRPFLEKQRFSRLLRS